MSQKSYYIGIDFGTQGVRCGIIGSAGEIENVCEESYSTIYPHPGWAKQNPSEWIQSLDKALVKCINKADSNVVQNIDGISVCATASTVVPVDKNGNALSNSILWMDNRAKEEVEYINKKRNEVLKYCGGEVSVEWLIPKTLWIKNNEPDVYKRAYKIVEQLDFINYYLTGQWCASICQATCKGNYIQDYGKWVDDYFKQIGFDDYLEKLNTDVVRLGEPIDVLREDLIKRYKLPRGIKVYQGGIDAHIAMLGLGVCKPGDMGVVMGTSFVHLALSEKPIFMDGLWGPYNDAVVPQLFCIEGGQVSTGSITKWFLKEFGIDLENGYTEMSEMAKQIKAGSDGVITLDYFQGNRTPYKDPKAKGVIYGLTLSHTKAHIYRSILEGIAFGTKNIIDVMKQGGLTIKHIMACGGVTKNPTWLKIIADVTNTPIILTKNSANAGILGCAILCAMGTGRFSKFEDATEEMVQVTKTIEPDQKDCEVYKENYENYLSIYKQLKGLMGSSS